MMNCPQCEKELLFGSKIERKNVLYSLYYCTTSECGVVTVKTIVEQTEPNRKANLVSTLLTGMPKIQGIGKN